MNTEKITLDLDAEAKRLAEIIGLSEEVTYAYVITEDEYCDQIGLNVYGEEEHSMDCNYILDVEEMLKFISAETGIELETCEMIDAAEMQYYEELGLVG